MEEGNSQTERNLGKTISTWVQIVGILTATVWGVYTFVYKEIKVPRSAPVNITVNLQLKKVGTGVTKGNLTAVELKCSAANPSSRQIFLLPSVWVAYGKRIAAKNADAAEFAKEASAVLKDSTSLAPANRHITVANTSVVAIGRLFPDTVLKPGETSGRTIVFYVPKSDYDSVELVVLMPSGADLRGIESEWTLTQEAVLNPTIYRINKNGPRTTMTESEYSAKPFELQQTGASAEISLWPE
jgi:hypothetical protein